MEVSWTDDGRRGDTTPDDLDLADGGNEDALREKFDVCCSPLLPSV